MILLFVNLHVHTEWSLLDGMCRIDDLIPRVAELGQNAVGISDHGVMHGVVQFYKACKNHKDKDDSPHPIKPIIGLETYVVPDRTAHVKLKARIEDNKSARKKMTDKEKKADDGIISIKDAFLRLVESDESYFGNSVAVTSSDEEGNVSTSYRFANSHLLLFAKNAEGYKNLINIASESQLTGFYSKPRIDAEYLRGHGRGIIATSACRAGEIPRMILRGRTDLAKKKILEYQEIFDEFYLEIQPGLDPEQRIVNQVLIELSEEMGVPLVATTDAHYVREEDADTHNILLNIATDDSLSFGEQIYFIHSEEEMLEAGMPQEALDNTQRIADACNVELNFGSMMLPKIDIPSGYDSGTYISKLCYDSFYKYITKNPLLDIDLYEKRLQYELETIISKGLADYLLIVQDFLNWGREHNVYVGPGRGSAVGSLACFFMRITTLDPIEQNLMFERFLNPLRPSFPDIDSDFEEYIEIPDDLELSQLFKSGRQTVMEYIISKYGMECICQIGTFGTLGSRSVLKDVGRALSSGLKPEDEGYIDHNEINDVTKFVPMEAGKQWTLKDCLYGDEEHERKPVLQIVNFAQRYPRLFDTALKLQGMPRHPSIHAAGVVICPRPVRELIPLMRGGDGEVVAQFDMNDLEELGLLKMDFLGLRTLGALHKTVDLIYKRHGVHIDMDEIPLNDPLAMKLIASGLTDGVFQIESDGMKQMFKSMNRVNFDNIVAGISLYRPGPMDFIPRYVACLNGHSPPEYLFPELEPILKDTYGVLIYQEQLMLIAKEIAGFGWVETDGFRKAVGKKKEKLIKKMIGWLIEGHKDAAEHIDIPGLVAKGVRRDLATRLGMELVSFGSYAFNKSHAAGYAKVVVITAYLKAHYPIEYMAPLISSYIGKDPEKVIQYINEAKRMGITILPPDVNASDFEFTIEDDNSMSPDEFYSAVTSGGTPRRSSIRYGLGAIKGLSKVAMLIYEDRMRHGPYKGIDDFLSRYGKREMNKKALDALVLSGSIDSLARGLETRPITVVGGTKGAPVPTTYDLPSVMNDEGKIDRMELLKMIYTFRDYGDTDEVLETYCDETHLKKAKKKYAKVTNAADAANKMALMSVEHGLLGMYLSSHPLDGKAQPLEWQGFTHGSRFEVTGIVRTVREVPTKWGKPMAFASIETLEGMKDVVIFTKEYEANVNKLEAGNILVIALESQLRNGTYSYLVKSVKYCKGQ